MPLEEILQPGVCCLCLQAQRQLQTKLLEHGQFIQRLMKKKEESGQAGEERACPAATGGELGPAPGSGEPLHMHSSAQGGSSGGSGNSEGCASRPPAPKKAPAGKQGGREAGKVSSPAKSGGSRGLQRVSSSSIRSRGAAAHTTTHLVLAPGKDHLAALGGSSSSLAAQPYSVLLPAAPQPLPQQQQEAAQQLPEQPQAAVPTFRLDPAVVLARLAHNMPIHEMELAALLGPGSHLTPTQVR